MYKFPKAFGAQITVLKRSRNTAESFAGPWIPLLTLNSFTSLTFNFQLCVLAATEQFLALAA